MPRIVTAVLPERRCRVQFVLGNKVVHSSRPYNSRNTWRKIIVYARTQRGGAPLNLPRDAEAIGQVLQGDIWVVDKTDGSRAGK
jgi:hypothetical protein